MPILSRTLSADAIEKSEHLRVVFGVSAPILHDRDIAAGLVAMQTLGFSIAGSLTFGGVGGIAIGCAAQDMLSNFFGGLMIYLDRPFKTGDWIRSPDREIEGVVEDEADEILEFLFDHQVKPEFVYTHKWKDGDLVIWDNRCVIHRGAGGYSYPDVRPMHRAVVAGDRPF